MAGVSTYGIPRLNRPLTIADTLGGSRMGGFIADFEQALVENPMEAIDRSGALDEAEGPRLTDEYQAFIREGNTRPETVERFRQKRNPDLTFDEARTIVAERGLSEHLTVPKNGIPKNALDLLMQWKDEELLRQQRRAAAPDDWAQVGLGVIAGISASILDPASLTAGMLPLGGPARLLQATTRGGRVARGAAAGAVAGAAESAIFEPLVYSSMQRQQADYDLDDSMLNVLFGAGFGGLLGGIGGAFRRAAPEAAEAPAQYEAPPEVQRAVVAQATSAVEEGRPVRAVEVIALAAENDPRTARAMQEAVNPAGAVIDTIMPGRGGFMVADVTEPAIAPAAVAEPALVMAEAAPEPVARAPVQAEVESLAAEVGRLRKAQTAPPNRESLNNFIADRGGINPDDPLTADLKSMTGNRKQRPGFYNRQGQSIDRAREAAAEAGYFGMGRDPQSVSIDEFLEAVQRESNGERVFPPERLEDFQSDLDARRNLDETIRDWESLPDDEVARRLIDADAQYRSQIESAAETARTAEDVPEWESAEAQNWSTAADQAPDAMDDNRFTSAADEQLAQAQATWRALVEAGRIGELEDNAITREIELLEEQTRQRMAGYKQAATCMVGSGGV